MIQISSANPGPGNRDLQGIASGSLLDALEEEKRRSVMNFRSRWALVAGLRQEYLDALDDSDGRDRIYKAVMALTSSVGRSDKCFRHLEREIDACLGGIMAQLRADFSGHLSESKFRLAICLIAGFDASLTASLLGWRDAQTVYREKHRLLQKIRLGPPAFRRRYLTALK